VPSGSDPGVLAGVQVEAGVTRVRVGGQRQVGIDLNEVDRQAHGRRDYGVWRSTPKGAPTAATPRLLDVSASADRPPSVDTMARRLAERSALPHPLLVDAARAAIADGGRFDEALELARAFERSLLTPVVNATGVLLHTNLGRAPLAHSQAARAQTVEFDLATGERGSRQRAVGQLFARLCGAEDAIVVNNNAAAVLLVVAALAAGRDVAVSRGESVEIGGAFRVPEVMEQSGARLLDVGTTNRTRLSDYERAMVRPGTDVALVLKVHPSNYRVEGFVEDTSIAELATLDVPVVADIGSGLLDASVPWMHGVPPAWLAREPAAVQTLEAGADLITFSGDKLFGGPQAGIIAGRRDLVQRCAEHPLARALRCGGLTLSALQDVALSYLHKTVCDDLAFWRMVSQTSDALGARAESIVNGSGIGQIVDTEALPGAGSAPGVTMPSIGVAIAGDRLAELRSFDPPIIARTRDGGTILDLRSVDPADDAAITDSLAQL
jgi:L-seryl-tRNA(Ser) seleniumtransferase